MRTLETFGLIVVVCAAGCGGLVGNGVAGSESRDLTGFTSVEMTGDFHATLKNGPWGHLVLTGDQNLLPFIDTDVSGGTLVVGTHRGIDERLPIEVYLTLPSLASVRASGDSTIDAELATIDRFAIDASGTSIVRVSGHVDATTLTASGDSQILTQTLDAADVSVDASGTAQLEVAARTSVTGTLSGVSRLRVWGQPATRTLETTEDASVRFE
jgi:hypothetical protein